MLIWGGGVGGIILSNFSLSGTRNSNPNFTGLLHVFSPFFLSKPKLKPAFGLIHLNGNLGGGGFFFLSFIHSPLRSPSREPPPLLEYL